MVTGGTAMKTMKFALLAVAAMVAASCVKETASESQDQPSGEVNYVQVEFTIGVDTKTTIGEDGKTVVWNTGDAISVFDNSPTASAHNNMFTVVEGGASTAVVTGSVPEDATEFYAYYPYRAKASFSDATAKEVWLNQSQKLASGALADDVAGMMALADNEGNFAFKNVCSHIKFTLAEDLTDVERITFFGNNMETVSGYFDAGWNGGNPTTVKFRNSFPYVHLLPLSGSTLTPGDYYFTVFPVNFEDGFTVVLTKTDGTHLIKRTDKAVDLSAGNMILPMKALASSDYKVGTHFYLKYWDGEDVTIGGYTFNKTTHPSAVIVSDAKNNTSITKDGLYFVAPGTDNVTLKGASSSFIVVGMEQGHRVPATVSSSFGLTAAGTVFLLANLDITTMGEANLLAGSPETFGHCIINNCKLALSSTAKYNSVLNLNVSPVYDLMTYDSICFEDSELFITDLTEEFRFLNVSKARSLQVSTFNFRNNIIHSTDIPTNEDVRFRVSFGPYLKIANLNFENNTFSNIQISNSLIELNSESNVNLSFRNNLFYVKMPSGVAIVKTASIPSGGTVDNNYFYNLNTAMESNTPIYLGSSQITNLTTYNAPFKLSASPLHETLWDPANDVYGPYSITPAEGVSAPTEEVGAYRDGMDTEAVSMLNSPSANYSTANLGKF